MTLGHYVGEGDLDRPGWLEACYSPEALGRLRALQALHDPLGRLRARGGGAGGGAAGRVIPAAVTLGGDCITKKFFSSHINAMTRLRPLRGRVYSRLDPAA